MKRPIYSQPLSLLETIYGIAIMHEQSKQSKLHKTLVRRIVVLETISDNNLLGIYFYWADVTMDIELRLCHDCLNCLT